MTTTASPILTLLDQGCGWLAINKPIGIGMHTEDDDIGLVVLAEQQFQRPLWPVHRLDKVTSGILLLATDASSAAMLSLQFAKQTSEQVEKTYLARSSRKPSKKQGWIKGDMAKTRNGSWKLLRSSEAPAITRFISHFDSDSNSRLFLLRPFTGKTHQLRVAMKSLACPIDGDTRYGGDVAERTYLHAYTLSFSDSEGRRDIICPPTSRATNSESWPTIPSEWDYPLGLL